MIMKTAIWWNGGNEKLTGVSIRESGRKEMETEHAERNGD